MVFCRLLFPSVPRPLRGLGRGALKRAIKGLRATGGPEDAVAGTVQNVLDSIDAVVLATITAVAAQ